MKSDVGSARFVRLGQLAPVLVVLWLFAQPQAVQAHPGQPLAPHDLFTAWNMDVMIWGGWWLALWLYQRGVNRLWARASVGHSIRRWQTLAFYSGLLVLLIALISPLDALSAVLFSAHMVQHLLLMLVAAPLFALSGVPTALLWALPIDWRRMVGQRLVAMRSAWHTDSNPLAVWVIYTGTLWLWHLPGLFQAALASDVVHGLEHLSFLGTAVLFWSVIFTPSNERALRYGFSIFYLFITAVQSSVLGALLMFSSQVWYPANSSNAMVWGLTPLTDQQLAGGLMWMPMDIFYLILSGVLLVLWFGALERRMSRLPYALDAVNAVKPGKD